jgi:hypothetical protein
MFSKELVDAFELKIVQTHLPPINTMFGEVARLAEENRVLSLETQRAYIGTRVLASLEILTGYADEAIGHTGIIQKNMREGMYQYMGITMDIPHGARVPISDEEKLTTGFSYGVLPELLPVLSGEIFRTPPMNLSQITEGNRLSHLSFPVFFSAMDRSVARLLSNGTDVGMLQGLKNQAKVLIMLAVRQADGNMVPVNKVGMMEDLPFASLLTCDVGIRFRLLKRLSRLLIMCICQTTWKQLVKDKVFGVNPIFDTNGVLDNESDSDGENMDGLSYDFKDFPFVEQKVQEYMTRVGGTKFVKKELVTCTGK